MEGGVGNALSHAGIFFQIWGFSVRGALLFFLLGFLLFKGLKLVVVCVCDGSVQDG